MELSRKLVVFAGRIGAGKTTLINAAFPDEVKVDVFPFINAYKVNGKIPEEKTLQGYQDMYNHLGTLTAPTVILELGTNHPEFNAEQLAVLKKRFTVQAIFCIASIETCWERIKARGGWYDPEGIERRFKKDFPAIYAKPFEKLGIPYTTLDMERPLEEIVAEVRGMPERENHE